MELLLDVTVSDKAFPCLTRSQGVSTTRTLPVLLGHITVSQGYSSRNSGHGSSSESISDRIKCFPSMCYLLIPVTDFTSKHRWYHLEPYVKGGP